MLGYQPIVDDVDSLNVEKETEPEDIPAGLSAMDRYLRDIRRHALLDKDAKSELWARVVQIRAELATAKGLKRAQLEDEYKEIRDQVIHANLRLVVYFATHYNNKGVELLDLIQFGNMGLLEAFERYDPTRRVAFITYAYWWVRQAITRNMAEYNRTVRIPIPAIEQRGKIRKTADQLRRTLGREPDEDEIAAEMGVSRKRLDELLACGRAALHLDTPIQDKHGRLFLKDTLETGEPTPSQQWDREELMEQIAKALNKLPDREAHILRLRFGLGELYDRPHTLEQIAHLYGLSRERTRQIEKDALELLKLRRRHKDLLDFAETP